MKYIALVVMTVSVILSVVSKDKVTKLQFTVLASWTSMIALHL